MAYKTILVQLDNQQSNERLLQYAIQLSKLFNAELTGLYIQNTDRTEGIPVRNTSEPVITSSPADHILAEEPAPWREQYKAQRDSIRKKFEQQTQQQSCKARFESVHGDARKQLSYFARYHDLTVSSQHDSDHPLNNCSKLAADVAVHSGHPVILLPEQQAAVQTDWSPDKTLIAWNNTPESARAVSNALPLLNRSRKISIFTQQTKPEQARPAHEDGQRLHHYLAQHDIDAALINDSPTAGDSGEELLNCAQESEQDLIVMGAYGHSKLHELLLGSTSRFVLNNTTMPVLISH